MLRRLFLLLIALQGIAVMCFAQSADTMHRVTSLDTAHWVIKPTDSLKPDTAKTIEAPQPKEYHIKGRVSDVNNNTPITGAVVYLVHTSDGATTDADGNFMITVDTLVTDSLRLDALGFKPRYYKLDRGTLEYNLNIDLDRTGKMLREVVVGGKAEDPALVLMRKVVRRKPYNNPDKAENYSYVAYNRLEADLEHVTREQFKKIPFLKIYSFIYDNLDTVSEAIPFLPLYLTETISDYYFRKHPKKQREFIKGSMMKGVNNESLTKYLGTLYQSMNVYRNYIPVFDKKYVSPINDNGPFYYKYTIIDTQEINGKEVYLVKFTPRRNGENCFSGYLHIIDSQFALVGIEMNVPSLANINWVDKIEISQQFAPVDTFWFVTEDKFIANFTLYNSKRLPGFIGRKTTTYHNIKTNDTFAESVLDDPQWKEDIIKGDSAKKHSDDWWKTNRPDSLSKNESSINKNVDSINNMPITKIYKKAVTVFLSGVYDLGPIELGPYFYTYSSNSVEGSRFRFSLGTPHSLKNLHFTSFLAYGTKDKQFKYGATGIWVIQRNPRIYMYGYAVHDVEQTLSYYDQIGADNIFNSMLRKTGIPWKLAFTDEQHLEIYQLHYSGFSERVYVQHQLYDPYHPLPDSGIFYDAKGRMSDVISNSSAGIELRWAYKEKYVDGWYVRRNFGSKYPVLDLNLTQGFSGILNSGYNYTKAVFSISQSINAPPFGHFNYTLFTGRFWGTLPYPLLQILPGNEYHYYNNSAFEMMNNYEFLTDKYAGVFFEHSFGGGMFNYIPVLKYAKLRQFWTAKGVVGSLSSNNVELNLNRGYKGFRRLSSEPYLELGTGVANILEFMRLDFVWRVTPKLLKNEPFSRYFGIFISANFQF